MIVKKNISKALDNLEDRYNKALISSNPQDSVYYSKLAILEYCGWLEESLDIIVRRSVKGELKDPVYKSILENIIKKNYGFEYKKHFRLMLYKTIGLKNMEKIENYLKNSSQFHILTSELEAIKSYRDSAAHTWIKNTTRTYPAPSYTKANFNKVCPILKNIYSEIIKL